LTPSSWKLFSMPARQSPVKRAATKTISRPAVLRKKMRSAPPCVQRSYCQPIASLAGT